VHSRQPAPQTLQELQQALEQEWGRILQDHIRRLIESMPLMFVHLFIVLKNIIFPVILCINGM
jgi:hypothetical protein